MHEIGFLATASRLATLLIVGFLSGGCSENQHNGTADITGTAAAPASTPSLPSASISNPATAITLQGVPPTTATVGTDYSFRPTVSQSGAVITFTATGLPAWLDLDTSTGALSGMPSAKDVGTTGHIAITVSNGGSSASITPFTIRVNSAPSGSSSTGSVKLSWMAPTENTDGTPITNLAGYHIYYGAGSGEMTATVTVAGAAATTYTIAGLAAGTYYFSVRAYNSEGVDSDQSNVTNETI
jgi:hypothetical protein